MPLSVVSRCRFALWLLLLTAGGVNAQDQIRDFTLISEVEHVVDDRLTPPPADAPWEPLQLPFGDRQGDPETAELTIWMRFTLARPENNALHSLYFYRHNLSQEVFFNGERIGGDTYRAGRQTTSWNHPLLVEIQNANWVDGNNTVDIRFSASYYGGTYAPIVFGEHSDLLPLYEQRLFRQVQINEWLQLSGIIGVLIALVL